MCLLIAFEVEESSSESCAISWDLKLESVENTDVTMDPETMSKDNKELKEDPSSFNRWFSAFMAYALVPVCTQPEQYIRVVFLLVFRTEKLDRKEMVRYILPLYS